LSYGVTQLFIYETSTAVEHWNNHRCWAMEWHICLAMKQHSCWAMKWRSWRTACVFRLETRRTCEERTFGMIRTFSCVYSFCSNVSRSDKYIKNYAGSEKQKCVSVFVRSAWCCWLISNKIYRRANKYLYDCQHQVKWNFVSRFWRQKTITHCKVRLATVFCEQVRN
jgi:hypothetical protein